MTTLEHPQSPRSDSSEPPRTSSDEDDLSENEIKEMKKEIQLEILHKKQQEIRQRKKQIKIILPQLKQQFTVSLLYHFSENKLVEFFVNKHGDFFLFQGNKFESKILVPYVYVTNKDDCYMVKIIWSGHLNKQLNWDKSKSTISTITVIKPPPYSNIDPNYRGGGGFS